VLASWKIGAVVIALGALGGGAAVLMSSKDAPAPANLTPPTLSLKGDGSPVTEEHASKTAPVAEPEPTTEEAAPEPPAVKPETSAKPAPRPSNKPTAKPDDLATEADLLARAQSALTSGDAKKAIALCDEHAARFPKGALAADRDRLRARAKAAQ
jgi:outer membrane biosynthesis protein TonB